MEAFVNHIASSDLTQPRALIEQEYEWIQSGAGFYTKKIGILELRGKDSLDLLHRLSTNDIKTLQPHRIVQTVLTTEKGRIIDVITVCNHGDFLTLLTGGNNAVAVKEWLDKFIIMEELEILDVTIGTSIFTVMGVQAESIISYLTNGNILTDRWSITKAEIGESNAYVYRDPMWTLPSFNVMLGSGDAEKISELLTRILPSLNPQTVEMVRIEEGIPKSGREITEQVNPLEAGLQPLISFTKGCYIGQEVIARLDTYKKTQRKLSGFVFDRKDISDLTPGTLFSGGFEVGWTTSHTYSQRMDAGIALGYLKEGQVGERVELESQGQMERHGAKICNLPFKSGAHISIDNT
ncbi:MAG: aminomethyl transferase family protein [Ignavibacteria bacterium]|nr:aminomethyl transferase family protein [Ignavibacteria bacterium]